MATDDLFAEYGISATVVRPLIGLKGQLDGLRTNPDQDPVDAAIHLLEVLAALGATADVVRLVLDDIANRDGLVQEITAAD